MISPLVSIIIPIYKVEPYLRRCLDSIVNQTYTNLEIILVDDGSPDGCPQICDEYAAKDKRIIVIHKENGGLSDARNAGLDICKGEYISFVDRDDWIGENYIETLVRNAVQNHGDISACNITDSANSLLSNNHPQIICLSPSEAIAQFWTKNDIAFTSACCKIYKRFLWETIRFPKGKIHEDVYTSYKLLYSAASTIFIDKPLYFYRRREGSITQSEENSQLYTLEALIERYKYFSSKGDLKIQGLCASTLYNPILYTYLNYDICIKKIMTFLLPKSFLVYFPNAFEIADKTGC